MVSLEKENEELRAENEALKKANKELIRALEASDRLAHQIGALSWNIRAGLGYLFRKHDPEFKRMPMAKYYDG